MSVPAPGERVAWVAPPYGRKVPAEVDWVAARLQALYRSEDLGNRADPIEELVWIPLTRQTHQKNAMRSWQRIVDLGGPAALLDLSEHQLAGHLTDSGFSRQKARWIKRSLEIVIERFGALSLSATAGWSNDEVEAFLVSLPGIAIKSARCVMIYSLGRQVFPVDTHVRRIAERIGWVQCGLSERRIHDQLEEIVPPQLRLGLHVNMIWHGRSVCRALRPQCSLCTLERGCAAGVNKA